MNTTLSTAVVAEVSGAASTAATPVEPNQVQQPSTDLPAKKIDPVEVDTQTDRAISMDDVAKAVEQLRTAVDMYSPSLKIGFDGELNKMVVRVTDSETEELIRELPPEEVLEIARFLERNSVNAVGSDSLRGMLVDEYR
jgi:flagellar protein FlaG